MKRIFVAAGAHVASAALLLGALLGTGGAAWAAETTVRREPVRLLDVPYVPQSEALCGGAAVAMVLRYWGEPGVLAEDFAPLVESGGIRADALAEAVRARGWTALAITATASDIQGHLVRGRPIVAQIQTGSGSFHYVVLLAWANGGVILHDPAVAPFRTEREEEFEKAWSAAGRWALLILPTPGRKGTPAPPDTLTSRAEPAPPESLQLAGCAAIVREGVRLARGGDAAEAERRFLAAQALCPDSAAPLRELAGLRFKAEDWKGAAALAEQAVARDPKDAHAWRLLAGSRYLAGHLETALDAWNHVSEPRADVTRIDGLRRTSYRVVSDQIDVPAGSLVTPQSYRRARRNLADLPAQSGFRFGVKPLPGGNAQVSAAVVERSLVFDGKADAAAEGVRAVVAKEVRLAIASPLGMGELWSARWRWRANRPRVSMALAMPAVGGFPGVWREEAFWERQAYAADRASPGDSTPVDADDFALVREERSRAALSFSNWALSDLRIEFGAALDRWLNRGSYGSIEGGFELRSKKDRVSVELRGAGWARSGGHPFQAGEFLARWGSVDFKSGPWLAHAGITSASSRAPLALWSGAGTGTGRAPLLRAHPLLEEGILTSRVFGRTLLHGGAEGRGWAFSVKPIRVGWAVFVDAAKPFHPLRSGPVPWQVDPGIGLRLGGPGTSGELRIDAAHGLRDGESAVSITWGAR